MKKILFCLFLLSACEPSSHFTSANQLKKTKVILFLRNQDSIPGELYVSFENDFNAQVYPKHYLEFIPQGKAEIEHIDLDNIAGYSMGANFFALKNIKTNLFEGSDRWLFVRRMTSENSKIRLYELYESGVGNATGEPNYSYYLSFPSFAFFQTINARSTSLFPFFDLKMSGFVSDCPALAKKIKTQEKGYYLPSVFFNAKKLPEVLLRIINEYNQCQ
jgi:hypothetical protein